MWSANPLSGPSPQSEPIQHAHAVAAGEQPRHQNATDVAATTRDEDTLLGVGRLRSETVGAQTRAPIGVTSVMRPQDRQRGVRPEEGRA